LSRFLKTVGIALSVVVSVAYFALGLNKQDAASDDDARTAAYLSQFADRERDLRVRRRQHAHRGQPLVSQELPAPELLSAARGGGASYQGNTFRHLSPT
jgi:hypothetical protein